MRSRSRHPHQGAAKADWASTDPWRRSDFTHPTSLCWFWFAWTKVAEGKGDHLERQRCVDSSSHLYCTCAQVVDNYWPVELDSETSSLPGTAFNSARAVFLRPALCLFFCMKSRSVTTQVRFEWSPLTPLEDGGTHPANFGCASSMLGLLSQLVHLDLMPSAQGWDALRPSSLPMCGHVRGMESSWPFNCRGVRCNWPCQDYTQGPALDPRLKHLWVMVTKLWAGLLPSTAPIKNSGLLLTANPPSWGTPTMPKKSPAIRLVAAHDNCKVQALRETYPASDSDAEAISPSSPCKRRGGGGWSHGEQVVALVLRPNS